MQETASAPSSMIEKKTGGRMKSRIKKSTAKMLVASGLSIKPLINFLYIAISSGASVMCASD
ncbi:MAG: hypothetical protein ACU83V_06685 [Gammaproteobacteria bacterium]